MNWKIAFEVERTPLALKTGEILARYAAEHWGIRPELDWSRGASAAAVLRIAPELGAESFRLTRVSPEAVRVEGGDERGLLYGVGKFLRGCHHPGGAAQPVHAGPTGSFRPGMPVRGMYFATHFHNFYHDAPLAQVERYIEDLALWGCNSLSVWFDMHHYSGIDDPAARRMIARLHALLKAANGVGMGASLTSLANEAYHTSPAELRAEPFPAHYHVEICPSRPAGLELILRWREEMLKAFSDLEINHFWIWPYDQGGCKCADCAPWGGNGFVRNAEAVGRLVHRMMPRAKTVISTWEMGYWYEGDTEWDAFYRAVEGRPDWADLIMAEHHGDYPAYVLKHGAPGGLPLLNFPEISMFGMRPWGGFGANLQPARLQKVWNSCKHLLAGGYPYSEGIFEDLNKVICLQLYWDKDRPVEEIVREYAAAEFGPAVVDEITKAVYGLERNMDHGFVKEFRRALYEGGPLYRLARPDGASEAFALLEAAAARLPIRAVTAWRWRMLWLRAALDAELARSGGKPTGAADAYFEEVGRLSCAEEAELSVTAASRRLLSKVTKSW